MRKRNSTMIRQEFINGGSAIYQLTQRLNGHCYVSAFTMPTSDVKQYFLLRKSAVFSKLNNSKSSWNFFVKLVAFCRDKKFLHLKPKT